MKSKLAMWSWILPLISLVFSFIVILTAGEALERIIFVPIFVLGLNIPGLILGIVALIRIPRNPKLTGRAHAIVGIVLNGIILIFILWKVFTLFSIF